MARKKVRSGVRSTINFLRRQIAAGRKVIREAVTRMNQLKRADRRVRRLEAELKRAKAQARQNVRGTRLAARRPGKYKGMKGGPTVVDIAFAVLSGRKRPMTIVDLAARVVAKKKARPGANFTQNLGAALNRDKRFVRTGRGIYTVRRGD